MITPISPIVEQSATLAADNPLTSLHVINKCQQYQVSCVAGTVVVHFVYSTDSGVTYTGEALPSLTLTAGQTYSRNNGFSDYPCSLYIDGAAGSTYTVLIEYI